MKYENTAEIGDLVKAFDFEPCAGRKDMFIVGIVREKGWIEELYKGYTIEVLYDSTVEENSKYTRVGMKVYTPFEVMMMEYDGRVTKV